MMKALVKSKREPGLWLEEVPEPTIGINDLLIRVLRTVPTPLVVGHEFVGEVVEIGANVNDFRPGDIVSGEGHLVCGRCRNCMAGRRVQCANTKAVGVNHAGAFAEFIALPAA